MFLSLLVRPPRPGSDPMGKGTGGWEVTPCDVTLPWSKPSRSKGPGESQWLCGRLPEPRLHNGNPDARHEHSHPGPRGPQHATEFIGKASGSCRYGLTWAVKVPPRCSRMQLENPWPPAATALGNMLSPLPGSSPNSLPAGATTILTGHGSPGSSLRDVAAAWTRPPARQTQQGCPQRPSRAPASCPPRPRPRLSFPTMLQTGHGRPDGDRRGNSLWAPL